MFAGVFDLLVAFHEERNKREAVAAAILGSQRVVHRFAARASLSY